MESNIEAYDSFKTLLALDVKPFLENFNEQLKKRYNEPDKAEEYKVYEIDELVNIENDPTLTSSDKELISQLKEIKRPSHRAQQLLNGIENFFNASVNEREIDHSLSPSEPRAKLRRTAAILYKNAQIPEININRGALKEVSGPLGVDKKYQRPTTQLIIDSIGPVWKWDGNIPNLSENDTKREGKQIVFVSNNPDSPLSKNITSRIIDREIEVVLKLNAGLDNPPYLPRIYQKTENGRYIESIPVEFPHGDIVTRLGDVIQVGNAFTEMWQVFGLIISDTKAQNFRKRNNGEVVIIDTGEKIIDFPRMTEFDSKKLAMQDEDGKFVFAVGYTNTYTPPEYADILSGEIVSKVKSEPFLVYQLGILLMQSFYDSGEVHTSIYAKKGKRWIDRAGEHMELKYSVNQITVTDLLERFPNKVIPKSVTELLASMVNDDPNSRPSLKEVTSVLEETIKKINEEKSSSTVLAS